MFIIFMQGRNSPESVEFISVQVCNGSSCPIRDPKRFSLSSSTARRFCPI